MKLFKKALLFAVVACALSSFKNKDTTWVAIGDSITYLNDHQNETGNRLTRGYLTQVTEQLPGLHYINKGFNGWTSVGIAEQIEKLGLVKADIYSVFLGTNDWWQGKNIGTLDDYKNNTGNASVYGSFRIIIDKLHSLNPDAKILLITPMQRADFVYINDPKNNAFGSYRTNNGQSLEAFAEAVKAIGAYNHIPVIDLYHNKALTVKNMAKFKRLKNPETGLYANYKYPQSTLIPYNPTTDEYPYPTEAIDLTYDGLHPSDKGCSIIAKAVVKEFKRFISIN